MVQVRQGKTRSVAEIIRLDEGSLADLLSKLKTLPASVETRVLRSAGRKAATAILNTAKRHTPRRKESTKRYRLVTQKHLQDVLQMKQKTYGRGDQSRTVFIIGPASGKAPHAHLVEFGTGPRWTGHKTKYAAVAPLKIKTKTGYRFKRRKVSIGSFRKENAAVVAYRGVMPAFRPLTNALNTAGRFAQRAMESEIKAGIEREARR